MKAAISMKGPDMGLEPESFLSDSSLLTFSLHHVAGNPSKALRAPYTPSSDASSSVDIVHSSRSWLPGLLSDNAVSQGAFIEREEEDLDGGRVEEPFLWRKKLFGKGDTDDADEADAGGDTTGTQQYRKACENHGILPSLAVLSSLQVSTSTANPSY
jgi:hypothetical protein